VFLELSVRIKKQGETARRSIINYSSALREDARKRLAEIQKVDFLVGIPCYHNQTTIERVLEVVGDGLKKHFPRLKSLVVVSDGGSTDDSRELAGSTQLPGGIEKLVTIYRGLPGKGSSLRAVLEISEILAPSAVIVVDADLKSISPDWVKLLAEPILERSYDFVTPFYSRHKFDGTITKLVAYPLTRSVFRKRVHQPIGGEFGFSGELAKYYTQQDVWDTDVAKFGIDIWLTVTAIEQGFKICQARLGTKIHNRKDPLSLGKMFREVTGTIFALMEMYQDEWHSLDNSEKVDYFGEWTNEKAEPVHVSINDLIDNMCTGFEHFCPLWQQVLSKETSSRLREVCPSSRETFSFPADLWAKVVYDFAVSYKNWRKDKQKLVGLMTPLYYGRVAAFCLEVQDMDTAEAEAVAEKQAAIFEDLKPYLVERAEEDCR